MKNLLFLLIIFFGTRTSVQQENTVVLDTTTQIRYGSFEGLVFLLNGKLIPQQELAEHPDATLHNIYSRSKGVRLEGLSYRGEMYFYTPDFPSHPLAYADDPAWFINGRQVSPFDIRASQPNLYTKITKSTQDTVIDGTKYKGCIHITTEQDFFAKHVSLSEILCKYKDLPAEKTIVHWYSPRGRADTGLVITDNFPIYHLNNSHLNSIEVGRIRLAEGERYVIHIIDERYTGARTIFETPLMVDTDCPCYLTHFNPSDHDIFSSVEIMPKPNDGEEDYLERLAVTLMLPAEKSEKSLRPDSIKVNFVVTDLGLLANLESDSLNTSANAAILYAIKKNACAWSSGLQSGRLVYTNRKITIFYSKDQNGDIQSLDRLVYRPVRKAK